MDKKNGCPVDIDAIIETNGRTARIRCIGSDCVVLNESRLDQDAEQAIRDGDRISVGDVTLLWKQSARPTTLQKVNSSRPGSWAWRTLRRATEVAKPSLRTERQFRAPCPVIPHLHIIGNAGHEIVKELTTGAVKGDSKIWSIGADPKRHICLNRDGISSMHATLENHGDKWSITDELSDNGIIVNRARIFRAFLKSGDRIQMAGVHALLHLPQRAETTTAKRWTWLITAAAFLITSIALALARWWWTR